MRQNMRAFQIQRAILLGETFHLLPPPVNVLAHAETYRLGATTFATLHPLVAAGST